MDIDLVSSGEGEESKQLDALGDEGSSGSEGDSSGRSLAFCRGCHLEDFV